MTDSLRAIVTQAIQAVRDENRPQIVESLRRLAEADPGAVLGQLCMAVDRAAGSKSDADIPATGLLPEPARAKALLRAVVCKDTIAMVNWAPHDYPALVEGLIALAVTLSSATPPVAGLD